MDFYGAIRTGVKTETGPVRPNNEDSYVIADPHAEGIDVDSRGFLVAVADGMGGHAAGEVASQMACEGVMAYYAAGPDPEAGEPEGLQVRLKRLRQVIENTNTAIFQYARTHTGCYGMGTTLSALVLSPETAIIGHVGDSRIYRLRRGVMSRLTTDHTEAQAMIDSGYLAPERAAVHPFRHVLLQAVGTQRELDTLDMAIETVEAGDRYLLSTDGFHDALSDGEIRQFLMEAGDPQSLCETLVEAALNKSGRDNVTALIVSVSQED